MSSSIRSNNLSSPNPFVAETWITLAVSRRLSRFFSRQQVHFVHHVEPRLVLRFQLAQHFLDLRLLLGRRRAGDVGHMQ